MRNQASKLLLSTMMLGLTWNLAIAHAADVDLQAGMKAPASPSRRRTEHRSTFRIITVSGLFFIYIRRDKPPDAPSRRIPIKRICRSSRRKTPSCSASASTQLKVTRASAPRMA